MRWADRAYNTFMYPLEAVSLARRRRARMRHARGRVLEIGAGTGVNLRYYNHALLTELHLSDISLSASVMEAGRRHGTPVHYHEVNVLDLPFEDGEFDTVVSSLVFCSVADPARGLSEILRVLAPGGRLVFLEHVRPDTGVLRPAVNVLNPLWKGFNGECNINRDTLAAIREAGFEILDLHRAARGLVVDGIARKLRNPC